MRTALLSIGIAVFVAAPALAAPYWGTAGRNSQHTAIGDVATRPLTRILWKLRVDRRPQYTRRGSLLAHYGSPLITQANTVVVPVKLGVDGKFRVVAVDGTDGRRRWSRRSDYVIPPHRWLPTFSPVLSSTDKLWIPAAGGTVLTRTLVDEHGGQIERRAYYGLENYLSDRTAFRDSVFINTPLTADGGGNVFFGVEVVGTPPSDLESVLVRMSDDGQASWVTPAEMTGDAAMTQVLGNSAPAISPDGTRLYVAVTDGAAGYLVGLDARTLETRAMVRLVDPSSAIDALLLEDGTAAPTVGPDGHVYFGVLEQLYGWNHGRGWLMHFDADLVPAGYVGAFGWDDTPSIIPAAIVASYTGPSSYLILSKYNDYATAGGTGINRIAVLDPNVGMRDPVTGLDVMNEVMTVRSPTVDDELVAAFPNALREWCINTAAVDPITKSVLANNEDGRLYRWDLTTGELSESIELNGGLGQGYTPTLTGPDGTVYAINDATLFAIGDRAD
ncbi:MAG TPA: hypothetical protein VEC57_06975 [Candidatus Limnocylindrales bacterium]|nr:hypothetical protein [Candidatus Limnocylindrales bacterium]